MYYNLYHLRITQVCLIKLGLEFLKTNLGDYLSCRCAWVVCLFSLLADPGFRQADC